MSASGREPNSGACAANTSRDAEELRSDSKRYLDDDAICALAETSRTRKNLRTFNVGGNKFTNVSCLASLLDLEHLGMGDNEINDINPLSTLVKLKFLQLSDNKLTILPPSFSSLVNLERLILYDND